MGPASRSEAPARRAGWPLVVLLCGLPVWWVTGLFSIMPLLVSVPMAWHLLQLPTVRVPRGFGWWLLYLVWVVLGIGVLWADAPGAVPGGGSGRLMVFGYRLWWYAACTIVLLWIANLPREALPDRRVLRLGGAVFVVTALGGLLGVLQPALEFRSLMELVLPKGLGQNQFVASMIHPATADIESVLGRPEPRPKAPFPFTNSWGSGLSISLVFFVAALRETRWGARLGAAVLLVVAAVPVLYSLNRGLWGSLLVGLVGMAVLLAIRRRPWLLVVTAGATALALALGTVTPAGSLVAERWQHQHSNDRRSQLLQATVSSMSTGSPVVGYGSTRNVQGSFASIAGAATPTCPACGVPPLGTQGELWLVLFSQGWFGLAFFLIFLLLALSRSWRCRTTNQTVFTFVLVFFLLQLPVYDSLGLPLYLVMVALGLVLRDEILDPQAVRARAPRTFGQLSGRVVRGVPVLGGLAALGAGAGAFVAASLPTTYQRSVWIELAPAPVTLDHLLAHPSATAQSGRKRDLLTLDTESALLRSPPALSAAARTAGTTSASLDRAIEVAALPNSRILTVSVSGPTSTAAVRNSQAVTAAYLDIRGRWLTHRRTRLADRIQGNLGQLASTGPSSEHTRRYLVSAIARVAAATTSPGTVVRTFPPEQSGSRRAEIITSGLALGLLAGCAWLNRTTRRRS